jgi:two-component system, chemotaxis family, CheB/CheR fusion protein
MPKRARPEKRETVSDAFPVVGVGASAGGLEAFSQLLQSLPAETGMAFVLVQHLAPQHESILPAILSRSTAMPVRQAEESMPVEPNHVYVIPPGQDMLIHDGRLALRPREPSERPHMPVDLFLRTLADGRGKRSVAVVLSGTGSDGTLGCKAVKSAGGISFAQDPASARYDGMPRSAIAAGCVDLVLTPEGIGREIARLSSDDYLQLSPGAESESAPGETDKDPFHRILVLLNEKCGIDFEAYKKPTLVRRIRRRMVLRRIERFPEYLRWLEKNPAEVESLHHDLLINVTTFFRDPSTFEFLATHAFPKILEDRPPDAPVRVWVPGCATGEEAYSMAMALLEGTGRTDKPPTIQVFGTDVSPKVIDRARAGIYPESIAADVAPERLARFFVKRDGTYQVAKEVRDLCVFAAHDLIEDPPFSRMDIISCRNVLIYLEPSHQKRVLASFHYALNSQGVLVLGSSETVGALPDRFAMLGNDQRVYTKKPGVSAPYGTPGVYKTREGRKAAPPRDEERLDRQREADRILLARYGPPGVLVDDNLDILQFRGDTSPFLEHSHGEASLNLLRMLPKGQVAEVRKAIDEARARDLPCRREPRWGRRGRAARTAIDVIPVHGATSGGPRSFLVLFDAMPHRKGPATRKETRPPARSESAKDRRIADLEGQLEATKQYQQALAEEHEAAHEELQSTHEEVLSSNEELQSINEELETAKEELQSANEELTTLNEELQNRSVALGQIGDDLVNLLSSLNIPIVMLDPNLKLRRFTPAAASFFNLIPTDAGRRLSDMRPVLAVTDLETWIRETLETGTVAEREVCDLLGRWYLLRVHPYMTKEEKVDGAVLMILDIDEHKRALRRLEHLSVETEGIVQTVRHPVLILDADLRVSRANRAFCRLFRVTSEQTEGQLIYELGGGQWNVPELRALLLDLLPNASVIEDFTVDREFPVIGRRMMVLNARQLAVRGSEMRRILVAIEDRTAADQEVRQALASSRLKDEFIATVSHELRGPLNAISGWVHVLAAGNVDEAMRARGVAALQRSVKTQTRLIEDLLDMSRILSGKLRLTHRFIDLREVAQAAMETASPAAEAKTIRMMFRPDPKPLFVMGDPDRLQQIVWNLLSNAVKFTPRDGRVEMDVRQMGTSIQLRVTDSGQGIRPEFLPFVFEPFRQADSSPARSHQGLGLGLAIVRHLVESHGGVIRAESAGVDQGSVFTMLLPVPALTMEPEPEPGSPSAVTPAPAPDRSRLAGLRVLVVEDDPDSRDILATMLVESGAEVATAESAREALAIIDARSPDVLVSDIGLPEMDGYALIGELRRRPTDRGGSIPAVALTAYSEEGSRRQAIEAGFQEHLSKPADPQAFLTVVARLAGRGADASI